METFTVLEFSSLLVGIFVTLKQFHLNKNKQKVNKSATYLFFISNPLECV